MDYLKVFVVTDKKVFNEYLKENRNFDLAKVFDNYKNIDIHLVPVNVPNELTIRYIGNTIQEYDIYINHDGTWQKASFYKLHEGDIDCLLDSKSIEDYEEYKQWEKIKLFRITNKEKFIDFIYDRLSDFEKIAIRNNSKKSGEQLLYLVEIVDEYSDFYDYKLAVKFEYSRVAHIFPDVTLDEDDIFALQGDVLERLEDCKIHKKYNNISINNSKEYILLSEKQGYGFPKIWFHNGRFIAKTFIQDDNEKGYRPRLIRTFGITKDEALNNLKNKLEDLQKKSSSYDNKDIEKFVEDDFSDY